MDGQWIWWGVFALFIAVMLALDLGLFQRRPHVIGMREALTWFGVWTGLALLFNLGIVLFHERGLSAGLEFLTGYLVEKSLSTDNVFMFILIFGYFGVPSAYHHKVLFWGIIGALVLRILFIFGGLTLMAQFWWTSYFFGMFLLATGYRMLRRKEAQYDPSKNWVIRAFRRVCPVTNRFAGNQFFVREAGRLWATPLLVALIALESTDIVFAADSIPAIFAITPDPFIVYTSNVFAMLGLRSLYFAVAGFMQMFHLLRYGFASIIIVLGIKMLLRDLYDVPVAASLAVIVFVLLVCAIVSLLRPRRADLKLMFERTERLGLIPFRRLLLLENIIDLGDLKIRDAMRTRTGVRVVDLARPWPDNMETLRASRYSRYPLVDGASPKPLGILHVKDLVYAGTGAPDAATLRNLARPFLEARENTPLEDMLGRFQRRFEQMAIVVNDRGEWTGIISIEDILEELVGRIGDEFDAVRAERSVSLADALSPGRVLFELQAGSLADAIRKIVNQIPGTEWPADRQQIAAIVLERERTMPTYLGHGLAIPHGRLPGLEKPVLAFARSDEGLPLDGSTERIQLIFLLLTPTGSARIQPRLLADIAGLIESDYVVERLRTADTPEAVIEAIRAGQQVALD